MRLNKRANKAFTRLRMRMGGTIHPWYNGYKSNNVPLPEKISGSPFDKQRALDFSSPILFMARGHSGTRALAKVLEKSGVFMGNHQDKNSLNLTFDSMYWSYGFQRTLVPRLFKWGKGCFIDEKVVTEIGLSCHSHHLKNYQGGPWGFKTCAGMFSHVLYRFFYPRAKYIYLYRDGRDLILSHKGILHLTHASRQHPHWEYFKILTFGVSNDINQFPWGNFDQLASKEFLLQHRYWIQAKSWKEHVRMIELLKKRQELSPNVFALKYEDLCQDPLNVLTRLFDFLEIEFLQEAKDFAVSSFHKKSIGRWKSYSNYVSKNHKEDMESIFDSMNGELQLLGYE